VIAVVAGRSLVDGIPFEDDGFRATAFRVFRRLLVVVGCWLDVTSGSKGCGRFLGGLKRELRRFDVPSAGRSS
jgi:hypothetical protein